MGEKNEKLLASRFLNGSIVAYKELFNLHYKPLCSFAKKYVLYLDIAEDLVQEVFVRFWEQREIIHLKSSVKSYLFKSTRNECLNYLKHQKVKDKYKTHFTQVTTESFFHDSLVEEELNQLIYNAVQSLPPRCKQIFELSRIEGKTFEEIAKELSISKNTIKNQLVSALKAIRLVLENNDIIFFIAFLFKLMGDLFSTPLF